MDAPVAPSDTLDGVGAPTLKPRIDPLTRLLVLKLRDAEPTRSTNSIAAVAGISEASARRLLAGHTQDIKTLAKQLMQSALVDRVEDWEHACGVAATKGDHKPTRDWLIAADVIEADASTSINLGFQVVVAPRPGLPDFTPEPVLTLPAATLLTTPSTVCSAASDPVPSTPALPTAPRARIRR